MDRFVSPLLGLLAGFSVAASDTVVHPEWARHFDAKGVRGTLIVFDPAKDRYLVYNEPRARARFLPASTFKIPNALIGLEVGAIDDENEVFLWDGGPKPRAAWERDHTLATGVRESVVWMFQEVARRVGRERMKEWLDRLDYGNRDMKGGIDLFWLQGALRISAREQVDLLRKLSDGELPMTQRSQRLVREALLVEKTPSYRLYAKTGSGGAGANAIAWWVGWIERKGRATAHFALNLAPSRTTRFEDRFAIARAILAEEGLLDRPHPREGGLN